ncbi:hypothetical protein GCM10010994_29350 [Chelatococcus reniformis]|uniref:Uncharacterized protein n=1 Tax=Chelatococcus reniformis TaxID=1494448 RepID=A0A916XF29_9HYPH|nr:hypothetical protein GCM10010994_29350 [Chelatococcus reniformis]
MAGCTAQAHSPASITVVVNRMVHLARQETYRCCGAGSNRNGAGSRAEKHSHDTGLAKVSNASEVIGSMALPWIDERSVLKVL